MVDGRHSEFWRRLLRGVEVGTDTGESEKLLGFRDGFRQFFTSGLGEPVAVRVSTLSNAGDSSAIPSSDEELLEQCRSRSRALFERLGEDFVFCVASESGLAFHELRGSMADTGAGGEVATPPRRIAMVKTWVAIVSPLGQAFGSSGGVQLPEELFRDGEDARSFPVPGRRRRGGMVGSLTRGLETRRTAVQQATLHALATLLYGVTQERPIRGLAPGRIPFDAN